LSFLHGNTFCDASQLSESGKLAGKSPSPVGKMPENREPLCHCGENIHPNIHISSITCLKNAQSRRDYPGFFGNSGEMHQINMHGF
jgi:hypothetical protein